MKWHKLAVECELLKHRYIVQNWKYCHIMKHFCVRAGESERMTQFQRLTKNKQEIQEKNVLPGSLLNTIVIQLV